MKKILLSATLVITITVIFCMIFNRNISDDSYFQIAPIKETIMNLLPSNKETTTPAKKDLTSLINQHLQDSPNLQQQYTLLITYLNQKKKLSTKQKLTDFANSLEQIGILELWLKTMIPQNTALTDDNIKNIKTKLLNECEFTIDLMTELSYKTKRLTSLKNESWRSPETFTKQWRNFKTNLLLYFLEEEVSPGNKSMGLAEPSYDFQNIFTHTSKLGRYASLTVLKRLAKKFNILVYRIKNEPLYSDKQKNLFITKLVCKQCTIVKKWHTAMNNSNKIALEMPIVEKTKYTSAKDFYRKMKEHFKSKSLNTMLKTFTVAHTKLNTILDTLITSLDIPAFNKTNNT